ncbi:MAG: 3-hydroxyacyl-CoA dehydrogenase family protein [Pseudomonadota bacterium]
MTAIQTVGVAGAGTMGTGIAIVAARAGFRTLVFDPKPGAADMARQQAEAFLQKSVARGKLTPEERAAVLGRLEPTARLDDLAPCDLVIEAIFEDLGAKHALFSGLHGVCAPHALFASNTSTLSISEIAAGSGRPENVVGMHFCLPAQLMKLVEMSPGLRTDPAAFDRAWAFCQALGQRPVRTQDAPGFILNYFLVPFNNDAIRLVEQGVAAPADIDLAIKTGLGYAMGPMELLDLVGLDTQKLLCEALHGITHEARAACPPLVKRMIAAGHLGKKSGRGFHAYGDTKTFGA